LELSVQRLKQERDARASACGLKSRFFFEDSQWRRISFSKEVMEIEKLINYELRILHRTMRKLLPTDDG